MPFEQCKGGICTVGSLSPSGSAAWAERGAGEGGAHPWRHDGGALAGGEGTGMREQILGGQDGSWGRKDIGGTWGGSGVPSLPGGVSVLAVGVLAPPKGRQRDPREQLQVTGTAAVPGGSISAAPIVPDPLQWGDGPDPAPALWGTRRGTSRDGGAEGRGDKGPPLLCRAPPAVRPLCTHTRAHTWR